MLDVRDGVAHLRLNRPEGLNAITAELAGDLMHAALRCDEDPEIRAVLVSGQGRAAFLGKRSPRFSGK